MKSNGRSLRLSVLGAVVSTGVLMADTAAAQGVSLNYERLSSLEEPTAVQFGALTMRLNGLLDGAAIHDADREQDDIGGSLTANFQVTAASQMINRWRVRFTYFGQYTTDDLDPDSDDEYTDNAALSVGSAWGTVLAGNVSGVVREQTRRRRGAGNAVLGFDDALGERSESGAAYVGRFGPWVVSSVVDEDGNFDAGLMSQRPAGTRDYRLTLRAGTGEYEAADGSRRFDTRMVGVVGEFIYGSNTFDVGLGHERFSSDGLNPDRWYVSAGVRRKTGMVTLSLEGHYGRIGEHREESAALGIQYDIARGLSGNLGVNYTKAEAEFDGTRFMDTRETRTVLSIRYSF